MTRSKSRRSSVNYLDRAIDAYTALGRQALVNATGQPMSLWNQVIATHTFGPVVEEQMYAMGIAVLAAHAGISVEQFHDWFNECESGEEQNPAPAGLARVLTSKTLARIAA